MDIQRSTFEEMAKQVQNYKANGKHEAAARLQEQMAHMKRRFMEVQNKFEKFGSSSNLEPRLSRALRELRGIEEATCLLELATEDPEAIESQLKQCLVRFTETSLSIFGSLKKFFCSVSTKILVK